jgi:hypothetical protein
LKDDGWRECNEFEAFKDACKQLPEVNSPGLASTQEATSQRKTELTQSEAENCADVFFTTFHDTLNKQFKPCWHTGEAADIPIAGEKTSQEFTRWVGNDVVSDDNATTERTIIPSLSLSTRPSGSRELEPTISPSLSPSKSPSGGSEPTIGPSLSHSPTPSVAVNLNLQ